MKTAKILNDTHLDDMIWEVREFRYVNPKALIRDPRLHFVKQRDIVVTFPRIRDMRDDMQVLHVRYLLVQCCELVKMGGEEAECMYL